MTAPNEPTQLPLPLIQFAGRSVLIVDDEPAIRTIARATLTSVGFAVTEAGDGEAAVEAIRKAPQPFDVILLDLTLVGISGAELIPGFHQQSPATRILVVTGLGPEEAEGIGADGFLGKPFSRTSLLLAVWQSLTGLPASSTSAPV